MIGSRCSVRCRAAQAVGDVATVGVRVVWDPLWSPEMIDTVAAEALGLSAR